AASLASNRRNCGFHRRETAQAHPWFSPSIERPPPGLCGSVSPLWQALRTGSEIGGYNSPEIFRLEARSADQRTIHIRHGHEFRRIRGLHGAAIENTHFRAFPTEAGFEPLANRAMNFRHI